LWGQLTRARAHPWSVVVVWCPKAAPKFPQCYRARLKPRPHWRRSSCWRQKVDGDFLSTAAIICRCGLKRCPHWRLFGGRLSPFPVTICRRKRFYLRSEFRHTQRILVTHPRPEVYGQKTTGQKTTRTKGHHRRNFVVYFDEVYNELCASKKWRKVPIILASSQTDMFAAEYRFDYSSGLNCRVIKIQLRTERLCLNRNLYSPQL